MAVAALAAGAAAGQVGGGIVSSVLNYFNQLHANESNEKIAQENRDFQHDEAAITRDWERSMSNTAYQRSMADMQAAGLNPNLIAGNAASTPTVSTPQGSTATMQAPKIENVLNGLTNALTAYSNLKLVNSMVDRNSSQISLNDSISMLNDSKSMLNDSQSQVNASNVALNKVKAYNYSSQHDLNKQLYKFREKGDVKAVYDKELGSYIKY